ncbi:GNAT family N-acetyltransferase [Deinococcus frigens]
MHVEAEGRVQIALERDLATPERRAWFLAEAGGEAVGAVEVGLNPAPPVYELGGQPAGLVGETFYARVPDASPALLDAAEAFVREHGAAVTVATCPAQDTRRLALLQERGYCPLTLWMIKAVNTRADFSPAIRPAAETDLSSLVRLNRQAQEEKRRANARFWTPHPDAPARFEGWMRHSLTLADRELLVSPANGGARGFAVAQPAGLPPAHDAAGLGLLDDLAADDWATFADLLNAAQIAFARQGRTTVQAVCPADWPERREALEAAGFRTANLWLILEE